MVQVIAHVMLVKGLIHAPKKETIHGVHKPAPEE